MRRKTNGGRAAVAKPVATPMPAMAVQPSRDGPICKAALPELPMPVPPEVIRQRAYEKWENAGRPDGDGLRFWLEAERELRQSD